VLPTAGEGVPGGEEAYRRLLFEWAYPQVADWCRRQGRPYPPLSPEGEILEQLPRTLKLRH
jgi:tRNA (guanosine-2'-O-)-methyltransferase